MGDRIVQHDVAVDGDGFRQGTIGTKRPTTDDSARTVVPEVGDLTQAEAVRRLLVRCCWLLRNRPSRLILDLHSVERADTKLVASLVTIYRLGKAFAVPVEINPSEAVRNALSLCQLQRLIDQTTPAPLQPI